MGKIARELSAPDEANLADNSSKVPFDGAVWRLRETGDFVNLQTGEGREDTEFDFDEHTPASEVFADDWGASA